LILSSDTLEALPDSLCSLFSLTEIIIDCNNLNTLPDRIGDLKNLKTLQVKSGKLRALPDSIGNLDQLITLEIEGSPLSVLPDTIGNLSKLTELKLLNCSELVSLPGSIKNLRSLRSLYIRGSKMTSLPDAVCNITSLINLCLQYTNISSLPASIGNLTNLVFLGIYNFFNETPYDHDGILYFNQNKSTEKRSPFAVLPIEVSKLASLRFLVISNTEVTSLPDYLGDLPALEKIEAVNCNIKTIPFSLQRLIDREELVLIRTDKEFDDYDLESHFGKRPKRR